jgi:hypothetical protein
MMRLQLVRRALRSSGQWAGRRPGGAVTRADSEVGIPGPERRLTAGAANHPAPTACGDRGGRTSRRSHSIGYRGSGRCARRAARRRRNSWRRRRGEGVAPPPRASCSKDGVGSEHGLYARPRLTARAPGRRTLHTGHGEGDCPEGRRITTRGDWRPEGPGIQRGASPLTARASCHAARGAPHSGRGQQGERVTRPENRSRGAYAAPTPTECGGRATLTTRRNPRTGCRGTCWSAR